MLSPVQPITKQIQLNPSQLLFPTLDDVTLFSISSITYCVIYSNTESMFCIIEMKKLSIMSPMCLSFNKSIVIQFIT